MAAYTTIDDPTAYFKVQIYNSSGADNNAITFNDTDTTMQPDFIWIKTYDAGNQHALYDAVRGATKHLRSNDESVEGTDTDALTTFGSNGFTVDADANGIGVNYGDENQVAWCWKANGSGSANTAGSINTTATSANTTSKFSIIHFTGNLTSGATIGHGLGAAPHLILTKSLDQANDWGAFHEYMHADPEDYAMKLNTTAARTNQVAMWNDTAPSSTLITLGDEGRSNDDEEMIAYCWAPVQGYSKFGSYTGNGNADGQFVYLGFRPAWLTIWNADSAGSNKYVFDYKRAGYNIQNNRLDANTSAFQGTDVRLDFLSNGFKSRNTGNPNTATLWIYAAFAEAPFVNSSGVPCNAR